MHDKKTQDNCMQLQINTEQLHAITNKHSTIACNYNETQWNYMQLQRNTEQLHVITKKHNMITYNLALTHKAFVHAI